MGGHCGPQVSLRRMSLRSSSGRPDGGTAPVAEARLAFGTIDELASLLASGQISSVELTNLFLDRLATHGPGLNAIATVLPDRALREAAAVDRRRRRSGRLHSKLAGIPYGAKDLLAARGGPTTYSAAPFRDQVLDFDATPIERLNARGAVLAARSR